MNQDLRLRLEVAKKEIARIKAAVGEDVGTMIRPGVSIVITEYAGLCTEYATLEAALAVLDKV